MTTAELIITICILVICSIPMIVIGAVQYRSREPVGFWSGKKPPKKEEVSDIKAYNRKHGLMWILYGVGFMLCVLFGFPLGGYAAAAMGGIEAVGGIIAMAAYHNKLNHEYLRKEE